MFSTRTALRLAAAFVVITAVAWAALSFIRPQGPVNIHVRWTADVTGAQRAVLEQRFGLTGGQLKEGTTWAYALADTSTGNITALIQNPQVDDTEHLNRVRFRPVFADDRTRQNILYAAAIGILGALLFVGVAGRPAPVVPTPVAASTDALLAPRFTWPTFGASLLLVVCIVAALWIWIPPAYDTNDDAAIRAVVEGTLVPGQPPTGFALLPHAALGWLLVAIERAVPGAYVWDVAVIGTLVWGLAVFAALLWGSLAAAGGARLLVVGAAVVVLLPLVGSVQYTISATVAGGAAIALAWAELQRVERARRSILVMAALLLAIGLMVRSGAAMAGALAVGAALLPSALQARRRGIVAITGLMAGSIALFGVLHAADVAIYKTRPQWDAYRQVNYMVTALFDWNRQSGLPVDPATGRSAGGWTSSDWDMLEHYWGVNPEVFGPARVAEVYAATAAHARPWDPLVAAARRFGAFDRRNFAERVQETWPALLAVLAIIVLYSRGRNLGIALGATALFLLYCLMIQAVFKDLPFRLFYPLASCFVLAIAVTTRRRRLGGASAALGVGVLLLLAAYQAQSVIETMTANHRHSLQVDAEGAALAALRPSLVVLHADTFPAEHWWRPFHRPAVSLPTIRLGRNNQNPQLLGFLARWSFPSSICDDPSVLVVGDPSALDVLSTNLANRSRRSVTWEPVYKASFSAYRCVPVAASR